MRNFYSFDEFSMPLWIQTLFWGIYVAVFVYAVWKILLSAPKYKENKAFVALFGIFFALYAVFYCVNPDYFRYREWLDVASVDYWVKEKFYFYLVLFCHRLPFDYPFEVFRLIVWGGGILISYNTFRLYRGLLLPDLTLLLLFVCYAGIFCYARASMAMAVYFFGIAISLRHHRIIPKLIGIGIAISSCLLHREMLIGIALLPCLLFPFEKKSFSFLSIIILLATIVVISYFASNLPLLDQMFDNNDLSSKIEEMNNKGLGKMRLSTLIKYLNFFYPFYLLTKVFWRKKIPDSLIGMYRITYGILMTSIAFMVVFGLRSVYSYRVMYITMIPLALLINYGYCQGYIKKRQMMIVLIFAILTNSIRVLNAQ